VAAPAAALWSLLASPQGLGGWWDARVLRAVPEGPTAAGQILEAVRPALGRSWPVRIEIGAADHQGRMLRLTEWAPFGLRTDCALTCLEQAGRSCRLVVEYRCTTLSWAAGCAGTLLRLGGARGAEGSVRRLRAAAEARAAPPG